MGRRGGGIPDSAYKPWTMSLIATDHADAKQDITMPPIAALGVFMRGSTCTADGLTLSCQRLEDNPRHAPHILVHF